MAIGIVVLAANTIWTNAVVRALRERFGQIPLVLEEKESVWAMLRRRRRRLGLITVIGQIGFAAAARIARPLSREQQHRIFARAEHVIE